MNANGDFIVEVDRVSVINSSVSCIGKLAATDECLVEIRYNVNRVPGAGIRRASLIVCIAVAVPPVGSMNVFVEGEMWVGNGHVWYQQKKWHLNHKCQRQ